MSDILDISKAQARVLRSIAYYEEESGEKGSTQYTSSKKVSNEIHVSGSTFNDNIKKLHENLMVIRHNWKGKTKPYSITKIGQICWLKNFSINDNIDLFQKNFPNIMIHDIENFIYSIENPNTKIIREQFLDIIFKQTLNDFHIKQREHTPYVKLMLEETIELSSHYNLVKTAYKRFYNMTHSTVDKKLEKKLNNFMGGFCENYEELKIGIINRIEFLFYYILIQAVSNEAYLFKIISDHILPKLEYNDEEDFQETQYKMIQLSADIVKKKKIIIRKITTNNNIKKIMKTNLTQLSRYNNTDFQQISSLFIEK